MSHILRRLRRLLRRAKNLVAIGVILFLLLSGYVLSTSLVETGLQQWAPEESTEVMKKDRPYSITLQTQYVCGIETETLTFEYEQDLEEWLTHHAYEWKILEQNDGQYTLWKEVKDDISAHCKEVGYFGISKDGLLTIFEGPPEHNRVIQTFFRIDTKRLESLLLQEKVQTLKKGIRIQSMDDYLGVLSTYSPFATEY